jgi:hypothetical protein
MLLFFKVWLGMGLSSEYLFKKILLQAFVYPNKSIAVQKVKMLTFKP